MRPAPSRCLGSSAATPHRDGGETSRQRPGRSRGAVGSAIRAGRPARARTGAERQWSPASCGADAACCSSSAPAGVLPRLGVPSEKPPHASFAEPSCLFRGPVVAQKRDGDVAVGSREERSDRRMVGLKRGAQLRLDRMPQLRRSRTRARNSMSTSPGQEERAPVVPLVTQRIVEHERIVLRGRNPVTFPSSSGDARTHRVRQCAPRRAMTRRRVPRPAPPRSVRRPRRDAVQRSCSSPPRSWLRRRPYTRSPCASTIQSWWWPLPQSTPAKRFTRSPSRIPVCQAEVRHLR